MNFDIGTDVKMGRRARFKPATPMNSVFIRSNMSFRGEKKGSHNPSGKEAGGMLTRYIESGRVL